MKKINKSAKIWEPTVILDANREIIIGPDCRIGQFCFIAPKKLVMERGAEISPLVALGGGGDVYMCKYSTVDYGAKLIPATFTTQGKYMNDAIMNELPQRLAELGGTVEVIRGSITLEEGATIGANAVVCVSRRCPNITIGTFSVIGAGSYIDHSVASKTVMFPKRKDFVVKQRLFNSTSP